MIQISLVSNGTVTLLQLGSPTTVLKLLQYSIGIPETILAAEQYTTKNMHASSPDPFLSRGWDL